jgi:hypothetical protein
MFARPLAATAATLLGVIAFAAPARAETIIVNGVLRSVDIIDPDPLEYGQTYPIPAPAYSVVRGYPHESWYESWRLRRSPSPVLFYPHPCAWPIGVVALVHPCGVVAVPVANAVEAPLLPVHRLRRRASLHRPCPCREARRVSAETVKERF